MKAHQMEQKLNKNNDCVGGHLIPNQMRYQAAPRSETVAFQSFTSDSGIFTLLFCTIKRTITICFAAVSIAQFYLYASTK
jgi:hypothetical protein